MKIEQVVGARIAEVRERRGMTQTELGKRLGQYLKVEWLPQAVWTAEQGKRAFPVADLVAFAHVLDIPVSYLLTPPQKIRQVEMPSGATLSSDALTEAALPADEVGERLHDARAALADLAEANERAVSEQTAVQERAGTLAVLLEEMMTMHREVNEK